MVTFSHTDTGTAESTWADAGLAALPGLPLDPARLAGTRFVVLAAHPDDETLGAGGLMATLPALGAEVEVLLCTAGEGSHPGSPTHSPEQLSALRIAEFGAALTELGLAGRWSFLGLPDRGLGAYSGTIAAAIRDAAHGGGTRPEDVVLVAPFRSDGHADHDALGEAAAAVAAAEGFGLLEYPIWYWHWATPAQPTWRAWHQLQLAPAAAEAKTRAMAAHATQVRPLSPAEGDETLLDADFLAHFDRPFEVFAWTPPTPVGGRPHRSADAEQIFDAVHAGSADPWNYAGSWYERRKRALTLAALPQERYRSALEVGCSIGTLTADLAPRCDNLLAVDASGTAADRASERLAAFPWVSVRRQVLPESWPAGSFDLVVVSEVGYYLAPDELAALLDRIRESISPGGALVLCHWRHPIDGWELDGETVHTRARERLGWQQSGLYREQDFVLEVLTAPGAVTGPVADGDADAGSGAGQRGAG
ncbi:PIG-L family deacetylase [Arthrobacter sp. G.S.26]|uniref:bifunctional PIG-L family deacetylase/class I SAM-dependent methyltransferase n=1 Tax=Micrococcaceae TaxID=1268 RepID=UPI002552D9E1|nr:bifunctional PIG-L family deacetylase/class I SAM-dependent methyltransferase [Pseudarthrobacter sp. MEB009]